ncbi:hypothetical protein CRUP_034438, partial [Coryphaenoides rupestris]
MRACVVALAPSRPVLLLRVRRPDGYDDNVNNAAEMHPMAKAEGQEGHEVQGRSPGTVPQDGARGWVMVGAMFMCTTLVFGLIRSLGVFFVEFVQYFQESAQAISWI